MAQVRIEWDGRRQVWDGIDVELTESIDIASVRPGYRTQTLRLSLPFSWDVSAWMVNEGHSPSTARAIIVDGDELLSTMPVSAVVPGRLGEATRLTLGHQPAEDLSTIPPREDITTTQIDWTATNAMREQARAEYQAQLDRWESSLSVNDTSRWGSGASIYAYGPLQPIEITWEPPRVDPDTLLAFDTKTLGRTYPACFGPAGADGTRAVRCIYIDTTNYYVMVAGHTTTIGTGTLSGPKHGDPDTIVDVAVTTSHIRDESGRRITIVDVSSYVGSGQFATASDAVGKEFFFAWTGTARPLPGNAAAVIERLLVLTQGIRPDLTSLSNISHHLTGWTLGGVVHAETSAWSLLREVILPIVPVQLVPTVDGIGAVYTSVLRERSEAVRHLVEGSTLASIGRPSWSAERGVSAIRNTMTLEYAASAETRKFTRTVSVDGRHHAELARSVSRHGQRNASAFRSHWLYDSSTAHRAALEMVMRTAVNRPTYVYDASPELYGTGRPCETRIGDVVLLTHASEGISRRLAMCTSRTRRTGRILLGITVLA